MSQHAFKAADLSGREKQLLFWASFIALAAAGFGFVLRVMMPDIWGREFEITAAEVGSITGAALWPIAITMILFSLLVDKVGYKSSMLCAFALQSISVIGIFFAKEVDTLWWACFFGGLGHGIIEACINPLTASIYREEKSKWLTILHASWPAGIVAGGITYLMLMHSLSWRPIFIFMLIPVIAYGLMFLVCSRFPEDERVEAGVPMSEMLREFGGLGTFLASTFLFYEIATQICLAIDATGSFLFSNRLVISLVIGAIIGTAFGFYIKSKGKFLFFFLCVIMIPLATAELATDGWIQSLMRPVLATDYSLHSGWAIVSSAGIMMVLRFFVAVPLKFMSPPLLLMVSSIFSIIGLYMLSSAQGIYIFIAFVFYAVGQTFYWPIVLGFVAERFPKGGAMTLNTVSALGLLTVGIFGFPFLGAVKDSYDAKSIRAEKPALYSKYGGEKKFFGVSYPSIRAAEVFEDPSLTDDRKRSFRGKSRSKRA